MSKTVLFQTIQFSKSAQFSSIWPIHRTISGATTPGQNRLGTDGTEGVLRIPQGFRITRASASDCLVSYQDTHLVDGVLSLCRGAVSVFYSPSRLGNISNVFVSENRFHIFIVKIISNVFFIGKSFPVYFHCKNHLRYLFRVKICIVFYDELISYAKWFILWYNTMLQF